MAMLGDMEPEGNSRSEKQSCSYASPTQTSSLVSVASSAPRTTAVQERENFGRIVRRVAA